MSKTKKTFIYHHLGLGDHIACNGLVRTILQKNKKHTFHIFCKDIFYKSIKFMYRDLNRLRIIPVKTKNNADKEVIKILSKIKKKHKIIKIGFENFEIMHKEMYSPKNPITFDMIFYNQLKIDYEKRFSKCYWKRDHKKEKKVFKSLTKKNKKYAFIHDDESLGYKIDDNFVDKDLTIIRNNKKENIFNMGKLIEEASELHLMESSIRNMSETLNIKAKKLFLYIWRRKEVAPVYSIKRNKVIGTQKNWKIIFMNPKKKNINFFILDFLLKLKFYFLALIK